MHSNYSYNLHYEKFQDGTVKCIEEEIPFEVPEGWAWCRLCLLTSKEIKRGKSPKYANLSSTLVFAQKCNLKTGEINLELAQYLDDTVLQKYSSEEFMRDGDIIINSTGKGTLGRVGIYRDTDNMFGLQIVPDSHITIVRAHCEILCDYLYFILKSSQPLLENSGEGSTNQKELKPVILQSLIIPIPPKNEQDRIIKQVKLIKTKIVLIENNKLEMAENIKYLKTKILDLAIHGKLISQDLNNEPASVLLERVRIEKEKLIKQGKLKRDKRESIIFRGDDNSYYEQVDNCITRLTDEELYDLPSGWEYTRLKDITIKLVDGSHNPPKGEIYQTEYIMASSRNINDDAIVDLSNVRYLSKEEFEKENIRTNISENDILLTTVATLGRSCIYQNIPPNLCLQRSVTVITPLIIIPQYLKLFFDSPRFQKLINKEATGTAQKGFYLNKLENVLIPIPPLNEQHAVTSYASKLIDQLNNIMNVVRE